MSPLNRRRFIQLGAAGTVTALGGCLGTNNSSDAAFVDWVPTADTRIRTAYINLAISQQTADIDPLLPLFLPSDDTEPTEFVPDLSGLDAIDDLLLRFPLQIGGRIFATSSLSLAFAGLGYLIDPNEPTTGATELFLANDTVVGTGDIDVDRADEALRSGREDFLGEIPFEVVRDGDEYTVYEPTSTETGAIAVSESAALVADNQRQARAVIDAYRGDHDRAVEENTDFEWVFETAGVGDILVAWQEPIQLEEFHWGETDIQPATRLVSQRETAVSSVSFAPEDDGITAELALQDAPLNDSTATELESRLGAAGETSSFAVDGDRVEATASYASDVIDIEFIERQNTTTAPQTTAPGGEALPDEVAAAVPENAFSFTHDEEQGTVRVNFEKSFDADKVTVKAVESDSQTATSTPGVVSYLTVYLTSGGDEVVVTVTVDGVTGEVAREAFQ